MTSQTEQRSGLFRQQAVARQQDRLLGTVLVVPPLPYLAITAFLLVIVSLAIALLVNGSYARKETVLGSLTPSTGVIRVYGERAGIIRQVLVQEGDWVSQGQALLVVNGDRILESGDNLDALLLDELLRQQQLQQQQLDRLPAIFANRADELTQSTRATQDDIRHLNQQQGLLNEQLRLVRQQRQNLATLRERNFASQLEADALHEKQLGLQAQQQELARNLDAQNNRLASLQLQQQQLVFEQQSQQDQLQSQLSNLVQSIAQLHGQRAYVVKASQAGQVTGLQVHPGQELNPQLPLMTIMPEGSELLVELLVPARAIGFVQPGQPVKLRYSAFSFQKFGLYDAEITQVASTVLLPSEIKHNSQALNEPVYLVTAKLAQQYVQAYGQQLPLKPGISLEADIQLAERALWQWLLEPLLSLKGRL